ncbi:hypothetical protein IHN63_00015 [Deinococcus sp. 6YEL10]|uniref:hypothetical protein n=1 Tax=Deinococcus sp. 6YEL10 TaxID=2745870 RepID=UPI001E41B2F0|nr:hypothetical protein [Deinococcus sp. 6YEL10]MCD0159682.1 hypothetical protein [Deinococcus sp. 6YEL10]
MNHPARITSTGSAARIISGLMAAPYAPVYYTAPDGQQASATGTRDGVRFDGHGPTVTLTPTSAAEYLYSVRHGFNQQAGLYEMEPNRTPGAVTRWTCGTAEFTLTYTRPDVHQRGRDHYTVTVTVNGAAVPSLTACAYSPAPAAGQYLLTLIHDAITSALAYAGYDSAAGYHTDETARDVLDAALTRADTSPEDPNSDEDEHYTVNIHGVTFTAAR